MTFISDCIRYNVIRLSVQVDFGLTSPRRLFSSMIHKPKETLLKHDSKAWTSPRRTLKPKAKEKAF
uniref:Uncharacterized protein n=1 Tax=Picea glauca TaxID=3330 RepID=A0A101M0T5_PICGL|nr:hypothetical protein ABT39_MTgene4246 [Picea glauca]